MPDPTPSPLPSRNPEREKAIEVEIASKQTERTLHAFGGIVGTGAKRIRHWTWWQRRLALLLMIFAAIVCYGSLGFDRIGNVNIRYQDLSPAQILLFVPAYLFPAVIAFACAHRHRVAIAVVNLLFGSSFIGWFAALIWALSGLK